MRTKRSFATLRKVASNVSFGGDNSSVRTNYSAAKSWRLHGYSRDRINGAETPPIRRKYRKRDRLKAMLTGWSSRYLLYETDVGSSSLDLGVDQNGVHEDADHGSSDDSLFSVMQQARSNTIYNRIKSDRYSFPQNELGDDSLRSNTGLKMTGSKRLSSRSIKERILHRLAKKPPTATGSPETMFGIPSELTKTIATCVLDNRSFVSTEDSLSGNLDLKVNIPLLDYNITPRKDTSADDSLGFTPRYNHEFHIDPPPKNLPKHLHAKWERSQMFKNTARTYDHEKWKSKQLLLNLENATDDERPNSGVSVLTKSTTKDGDNISSNIFDNVTKIFTPNNSSKVSSCAPSSPKSIFDTSKLFFPATPKLGNLSGMFSLKNRQASQKSLSSRFNSMASSFQSTSTISSSTVCKVSNITNKNFNYPENYSLYSEDTFCHKRNNKYVKNIENRPQDETFSEFSF
ncbi:uncharacterized protein AC631_01278 [Debaryomyces fabryi]|uniref:Uncharacterized protein n=1 Tax=Debaryomyces fabryi TaxID=58627 RepID=A0A0V1Q316_9ASCO|nr:uncharacterized protein AC631_01278 [Debaryomyces fabryi]KSA02913.1 hypothetical protein AC631_01278 [Debaryomyces fabryi]CUM50875.1 unnamed protein product [Debaryomyces fabryi]